MKQPRRLIYLAMACLAPPAWADNCETIRDSIASRVRAGGLASASLLVVDAGTASTGRLVGSCANGTRQIVLLTADRPAPAAARDAAPADRPPMATATTPATAATTTAAAVAAAEPAPAASAAASDGIPTECKDGSIVIGPDCSNPRAVRMTSSEIARRVPAGTR